MKKLLSGLLAITLIAGMDQLGPKVCKACEPMPEEVYRRPRFRSITSTSNNKGNSKHIKKINDLSWSFDDGIVVEFDNRTANVMHKKENFLHRAIKNVSLFITSGIVAKILSNKFPAVDEFFTESIDLMESMFDFIKNKCKNVYEKNIVISEYLNLVYEKAGVTMHKFLSMLCGSESPAT